MKNWRLVWKFPDGGKYTYYLIVIIQYLSNILFSKCCQLQNSKRIYLSEESRIACRLENIIKLLKCVFEWSSLPPFQYNATTSYWIGTGNEALNYRPRGNSNSGRLSRLSTHKLSTFRTSPSKFSGSHLGKKKNRGLGFK